jgi:hypothetical protein
MGRPTAKIYRKQTQQVNSFHPVLQKSFIVLTESSQQFSKAGLQLVNGSWEM